MGPWLVDIEQVRQDDLSRRLVLRPAQLSREGRLTPFMIQVADAPDFGEETVTRSPSWPKTRRFYWRSRATSDAPASRTSRIATIGRRSGD